MNSLRPAEPKTESRLLSIRELAAYLSLSYSQARELVVYRQLRRVALPSPRNGQVMERLLVDRRDADAWIEQHKFRS